MSRALPEMLHCLQTPENLSGNCMDLTVLERQTARMKWNQQQLMPQEDTHLQIQDGFVENYSIVSEFANSSVKSDPELANGGSSFENFQIPIQGFGGAELVSSKLVQPPRVVVASPEEKEIGLMKKMSCVGKENVKKRKADKAQDPKIGGAEETNEKRVKGSAAEEVANNRETSGDNSRENSKVSEVQKPDFIHVRARRGQATDSHSLAERVRREKISERMKYLQDLVPGCNKIIGKAGMLDEIINYVQSLQRQVEFLSMKLAAVNPRLDFNIEDFFSKEMFPSCTNSFSTLGMLSEMVNPTYLQYNPAQQLTSSYGLDMAAVSSPEMALGRTTSTTPVLAPKAFLDSSCFSHAQTQQAVSWENDLQSIYNVAFSQDRSTAFPSQP